MSKFFIHRPIFAIVIALVIVIVGTISAIQLPIAQYPQITPPTVNVSTTYTGASAQVVNETVAQIIENQVNGTQGMDYMSSNSDDAGSYRLTVTFELGTDNDMDAVKVQNNVAIASSSLPSEVQLNGVTTKKSTSNTALMIFLYSPNALCDKVFMKNYADVYLLDRIKRVDGVGDVTSFGSEYAMRIWLNPDKLANLNLTVNDVSTAIRRQNVQAPAGLIGAMPSPDTQEKQFTGKIEGRLKTPEEFGEVVLKVDEAGNFVRLKDIARIETGLRSNDVQSKVNGYPSVGFSVQLTSDANTIETVDAIRKFIDELQPNLPPDLHCDIVVDNSQFIRVSIREVIYTFFEALALVVIVMYIFLQSWRATVIPLLAVPVSLIGTFAAFIALGFSINTLTLFAMVLAIGLVVDDAIVVIENVERNMQCGLSAVEASEQAMSEVEGPVIAIAFVLAAVFVPVAFLGGITGILYRQFALTIAISMALSAFTALSLTPALCAILLKPKVNTISKFDKIFNLIRRKYLQIVTKFIRQSKLAVVFMLIICGLTAILYKNIPSTFVPEEDRGMFIVSVNLPEGTSSNHSRIVIDKIANELNKLDCVNYTIAHSGNDILTSSTKPSAAVMFVRLKHWDERRTPNTQVNYMINRVKQIGKELTPEAQVLVFNPAALPGLGALGGWSMQLLDMSGHSDEELNEITTKIVTAMNQRSELQGIRSTYKITSPIYNFDVDRDKVNKLGVDLQDVFTALQVNFGGYQVNDFNQFGRSYKVMLQSDMMYRSDIESLKFVFVKNAAGAMVPLDTLLKPRLNTGTSIISRFNATRSVTIQGNAGEGYSSGQAIIAAEEVVHEIAPVGFSVEWSGQAREEKKAANATFRVLALALGFVFLCLAALYESWAVPIAVLMTVPIGIFGALFSEYIFNLQNSVYMQIGVVMLIGLAAKNAILIVEFAKVRVDNGMNPLKAAIEAAGLRLRPILMTSFAFIIGCLPLALATGAGSAARNGMGTAVVGGMLFATALGIFLTPIFFVMIEYVSKIFRMKQSK